MMYGWDVAVAALIQAAAQESGRRGIGLLNVVQRARFHRARRRRCYDAFYVAAVRARLAIDLARAVHQAQIDPRNLMAQFGAFGRQVAIVQGMVDTLTGLLDHLLLVKRLGRTAVADAAGELTAALAHLYGCTDPGWYWPRRRRLYRVVHQAALDRYDAAVVRFLEAAGNDTRRLSIRRKKRASVG